MKLALFGCSGDAEEQGKAGPACSNIREPTVPHKDVGMPWHGQKKVPTCLFSLMREGEECPVFQRAAQGTGVCLA